MPSRRQLLAAAGAVGVAGVAGFALLDGGDVEAEPGEDADTEWPLPRRDATNTAYSPDAVAPREEYTESWLADHGTAAGPPVIAGRQAFLSVEGGLVALDAATGDVLWRFETEGHGWPSLPAVEGETVYVTDHATRTLHALATATGETRTVTDALSVVSRPHPITDGETVQVFAGSENGVVHRVDPATGELTWRADLFGTVSALAVANWVLYVGTDAGEVYTFELPSSHGERPTEQWGEELGPPVEQIAPYGGKVFVQTRDGARVLYDFYDSGGSVDWTLSADWARNGPVTMNAEYVSAGSEGVTVRSRGTGDRLWSDGTDLDLAGAAPVAAGDRVYVPDAESVHAYRLGSGPVGEGPRRFSYPSHGRPVAGLAVADGALFVAYQANEGSNPSLVRLDPA